MPRNEIFKADDLSAQDRALWIGLLESGSYGSPLLHPDFACLVAACRRDVRIIKSRDAHGRSAFLAVHKRPFGVARPIGSTFSDYHALIAEPGFSAGLETCLSDTGIRSFHSFNLIEAGASEAQGWSAVCKPEQNPQDDFARAHSKRAKQLRRLNRKLANEQGEVTLIMDDQRPGSFEALRGWKAGQFKASARHDVLKPAWAAQLLNTLRAGPGGQISGYLVSLNVDGNAIAAEFGPRWNGVFHPWLAAYDPEFSRYSPGHLLVHGLLGQMAQAGLDRYDLGPGDEAHKNLFANTNVGLTSGRIYAARPRAATQFLSPGTGGLRGKIARRWEQILLSETRALSRVAGALSAAHLVFRQRGGSS